MAHPAAPDTLRDRESVRRPCPGQILGTSRHCLAYPMAGPMELRSTPGPHLSQRSLDGLSLADTPAPFAAGSLLALLQKFSGGLV
jgi:hypothetical protein